jgi:hypothetical protein
LFIAVKGKAPRTDLIADRLDRWPAVIARFQKQALDDLDRKHE